MAIIISIIYPFKMVIHSRLVFPAAEELLELVQLSLRCPSGSDTLGYGQSEIDIDPLVI